MKHKFISFFVVLVICVVLGAIAYFYFPNKSKKLSSYAVESLLILPQHDAFEHTVQTFNQAHVSIDLVMYELNVPSIINALIRAKNRGVKVRVILQKDVYMPKGFNYSAIDQLQKAGVPLHFASSQFTYTHEKSWIVDGKEAYISTGNFNIAADCSERNFTVKIENPKLIREIERIFNADWSYQSIWLSKPLLIWSPINSHERLVGLIKGTQHNLEIYAPELNDFSIINVLKEKLKQHVDMTIITIPPRKVNHCKDKRTRNQLVAMGAKVYYMNKLFPHAKVIIRDYGQQGAQAFLGSENLSRNSLDNNRELGVDITNPQIVGALESRFQGDLITAKRWRVNRC